MKIVEVTPLKTNKIESETDLFTSCKVASISPKDASFLLDFLSQELSLNQYNLQHLKRIRRTSNILHVLLCPTIHYNDFLSIQTNKEKFIDLIDTLVPKYIPNYREEFELWGKYWPINYRPNELERERSKGLNENEINIIENNVKLLDCENDYLFDKYKLNLFGCIIVNPNNNKLSMKASYAIDYLISRYDNILSHPLYTPTLISIEGIAAIVREELEPINNDITSFPEDHYLCTGLDIYLTNEPDMLSAMALVHSRIRRIYFIYSDLNDGAVLSNYRLQELRSLNHKFRVFQILR